MLHNAKDLKNFAVRATDGDIGHVKDMYFDDAWVLRHFVVETGSWLSSRKVLVSPLSAQEPDWKGQTLQLSLTTAQVASSPSIDADEPVMRQNEDEAAPAAERTRHPNDDPHLRSCDEVMGYHLQAIDGEIGHIAGFLVDAVTWSIRYLVVDTSNWWLGNKVLIAPAWISGMHWSSETASVDLMREAIQASPPYDPDAVLDRDWEQRLHEHYSQLGYWTRDESLGAPR
jgi:hypothetical protein